MTYSINNIRSFIQKHARGFTLIETLVAVLLLATAIAGPLTIASKALTAALVSKDQITAYFLAQDAVEYVRFKRDSNCLASGSPCSSGTWLTGLAACTSATGATKCYFDSTENNPVNPAACASPCVAIRYDTSAYRFTYAAPSATVLSRIFTRTIAITNPYGGTADQALITVTVSWSDMAGITRNVVMSEVISNWQ